MHKKIYFHFCFNFHFLYERSRDKKVVGKNADMCFYFINQTHMLVVVQQEYTI